MILSIDTKELVAALTLAGRVVPAKPVWPILSNVKIVSNDNRATLIVSDHDSTSEIDVSAEVGTEGACALPFAPLVTFVRAAKAGQVRIEVEGDRAKVSSGRSRITLSAVSVEDFPNSRPPEGEPVSLDGEVFRAALRFCASAVTDDEARWHMAGVHFSEHDGNVDMFGTDSKSMHLASMRGVASVGGGGTLPIDAAQIVLAVAEKAEQVSFSISARGWFAACGARRMWGKVVDGSFPNVRRMVDQFTEWREACIAGRDDYTAAITVATCGADAGSDRARNLILRVAEGEPVVMRGQRAIGGVVHAGRAEMEATGRAPFTGAISSKYLTGAVAGMQGEEICLLVDARADGASVISIKPAQESNTLSMSAMIMALRASEAELADV
jgi:DNA polymerase III subunit beta